MKARDLYSAIKTIYYKLAAVATVSAMKGTNMLDQLSPTNIEKLKKAIRLILSVARETHVLESKECKKLKKVLNELNFRTGKDTDFPGGDQLVLVFEPDAEYKRQGKTHGAASHAVKHYTEFKPLVVKKLMGVVEQWIQEYETKFLVRGTNNVVAQGDDVNSKITDDIILNTFDYINDKKQTGKPLLEIERKIYIAVDKLREAYKIRISEVIRKAESIDTKTFVEIKKMLHNKQIVKFEADYFGDKRTYIFDPSDTGLVSMKGNTVQTYFRIDKSGTGISPKVKQYLTTKVVPVNDYFVQFLKIV